MKLTSRTTWILLAIAAVAGAATQAQAAPPTQPGTQPAAQHALGIPAPTGLRQAANAADCLSHVPGGGQGYYEHLAYGCSHPTAGYLTFVWDYTRQTDGFHIYRVDGQRLDYGIHNDGTMEFVMAQALQCFVVTAVVGSSESPDSNRYCVVPTLSPMHPVLMAPQASPTPGNAPAPTGGGNGLANASASMAVSTSAFRGGTAVTAGTVPAEPDAVKQHHLTDAEFQADLKQANLSVAAQTHGSMANPLSADALTKINASLRLQRQLADGEIAGMRANANITVLHPAPPPQIGLTHTESETLNAMESRASQVKTAMSPEQRMLNSFVFMHQIFAGICPPTFTQPGIRSVNGAKTVTFTPTKEDDLFTIKGCNFGTYGANSKVWIYGSGFEEHFQILSWGDQSIAVMLDPTLSGVQDLGNITLVVQRSDMQQATATGFGFYAARDSQQLTVVPRQWVNPANWREGKDSYLSPIPTNLPFFVVPPGAVGTSDFVIRQNIAGNAGDTDWYGFEQLPPGWVVTNISWDIYPLSCPGVVTYYGNLGTSSAQSFGTSGAWTFAWGLQKCSGWIPNPFPFYGWYSNWTQSEYDLKVQVSGPRGTENLLPH